MAGSTLPRRQSEFGRLVACVMQQRGRSAKDVAREARINLRHFYRLLEGIKEPSWAMVCRLADVLNCPTDHFRDWEKR